jgi:hypothetical protein
MREPHYNIIETFLKPKLNVGTPIRPLFARVSHTRPNRPDLFLPGARVDVARSPKWSERDLHLVGRLVAVCLQSVDDSLVVSSSVGHLLRPPASMFLPFGDRLLVLWAFFGRPVPHMREASDRRTSKRPPVGQQTTRRGASGHQTDNKWPTD